MSETVATPDETAVTGTEQEKATPVDPAEALKKVADTFKGRIAVSKTDKRNRTGEWKRNVELRIGKPSTLYTSGVTDQDAQTEVNPDWSLTKTKTANLYSQVPTVRLSHENKVYGPAVAPFAKELNYELGEKRCNVGVAMEEQLNDVVNAAGIGFVVVGYAARFETVEVPAQDVFQSIQGPIPVNQIPQNLLDEMIAAKAIPTKPVQRPTDSKFFINRLSPTAGLWPKEFVGSNFDDADYIGFSGKKPWAVAKPEWQLKEEDKERCVGSVEEAPEHDLRTETDGTSSAEGVAYDEIYYWRYRVDPDEKSFKAIWKLVFVHGITDPVVHEPWKGQKYNEQSRKYVGACKFPVRVLTLTYITDNPVPPSDSSAGRPQVNDMRRSRSQMFQNRERSIPIRWYDSNRIDPLVGETLMRGDFQGFIPTNGDGSRSIGEIARASYPSEDMAFDQQTKADLMETWQIGANQQGVTQSGRQTAAETEVSQANFATRIGQERGRVAANFLSICEVLAGLMALYSDFPTLSPDEKQVMQKAWDSQSILHDLAFKIRPDSTIVLDSNQRLEKLAKFLNLTAKSGFVNPKPIIAEMAELSGIDDLGDVLIDPQPKGPEEPNISYRFSTKDDLLNPVVMAMLIKSGQAPSTQQIDEAKKLLLGSIEPPQPPAPQGAPGAEGAPGAQPPASGGPAAPAPGEDMHPGWSAGNRIVKRSRDVNS